MLDVAHIFKHKGVVIVPTMKTVAERLKHARESKGWAQAQLASAAGLSQSTVGNIEAGTRQSKGSLPELAKALGVSHDWLANGIGEMASNSQPMPIPYTGPSSLGRELALVFDMIPESDTLKRNKAYALAINAIAAVLEGDYVTLERVPKK